MRRPARPPYVRNSVGGEPLPLDTLSRSDAVARLGGPFVQVREFTAPDEASRRFGQVIIGAPKDSTDTYDLDAAFTFSREGESEGRVVRLRGLTETQFADVPFAFDGKVSTARWDAQVNVTWRGQILTHAYRSHPIFPSIYVWRAIVYDPQEQPLDLSRVWTPSGAINITLDWKEYAQVLDGLPTLGRAHVVFWQEFREKLRAGEPLGCYLTTTVISPDDRDACVLFQAAGPTEFYINRRRVGGVHVDIGKGAYPFLNYPFLRAIRQTATLRLKRGKNILLVHTAPDPQERYSFYFGGAFVSVDGALMTDLRFE